MARGLFLIRVDARITVKREIPAGIRNNKTKNIHVYDLFHSS